MAIPTQLNRGQLHNLIHDFTGGLNVRHSTVQKMLKKAGVHSDVMFGQRFGKEKTTRILSTIKEHLETSYKEKGFGLRGRGDLFEKDPSRIYRQHVRKLAQDDIAMRNEARTDAAQRRTDAANAAQRQKLAVQIREQRRAAVQSRLQALQPNVVKSQVAPEKKKDETIVPARQGPAGKFREGVARWSHTVEVEENDPFIAAQAGEGRVFNPFLQSQEIDGQPNTKKDALSEIAEEEEVFPQPDSKPSDKPKDSKLPDTDKVDRGLPL